MQMTSRRVHTEINIDAVDQDRIRGRDLRKMRKKTRRLSKMCTTEVIGPSSCVPNACWTCIDSNGSYFVMSRKMIDTESRSYENTYRYMTLDDQQHTTLYRFIEKHEMKVIERI